jgi:hypothetical protein
MPNVQPVWQGSPDALSLHGVPIAWRRCLISAEFVEGCPMTKGPGADPKLGQPHRVALNLYFTVLSEQ